MRAGDGIRYVFVLAALVAPGCFPRERIRIPRLRDRLNTPLRVAAILGTEP